MNFHVRERISKSITCDFCCIWRSVAELPSRIVGFEQDEIEHVAMVAGWSTVKIGDESIRAGEVLNICAICKERAPMDLGRKFKTSQLDMDLAKVKLGLLDDGKEQFPVNRQGAILNPEIGEGGPW